MNAILRLIMDSLSALKGRIYVYNIAHYQVLSRQFQDILENYSGLRVLFLEPLHPRRCRYAQGRAVAPSQVMKGDTGYHGAVVAAEFRRGENTAEAAPFGKARPQVRIGGDPPARRDGGKARIFAGVEQRP